MKMYARRTENERREVTYVCDSAFQKRVVRVQRMRGEANSEMDLTELALRTGWPQSVSRFDNTVVVLNVRKSKVAFLLLGL
jgi:hypothetical protein